jgi:hypothetical protein
MRPFFCQVNNHVVQVRILKELRERSVRKKVTALGRKIWKELEGPRSGRPWHIGHGRIVSTSSSKYNILVPYVKDYFKWL